MLIEYKKLEESDYSYVLRLIDENLREVIDVSFKGYFNNTLFFNRAIYMGKAYIIYLEDSRCGFIWYSSKGKILHINTIIIDKEYQGKGIGSRIFDDIEKLGKSMRYDLLQLGVQGINNNAHDFYIKRGFNDIRYVKEFDTFYMQKKL